MIQLNPIVPNARRRDSGIKSFDKENLLTKESGTSIKIQLFLISDEETVVSN
jgi:hypothetical protein